MKILRIMALLVAGGVNSTVVAQSSPFKGTPSPSTTPAPDKSGNKSSAPNQLLNPSQPITTEIYADEAFLDSEKNIGKFTGHVKVVDPRFNMQSDKLTAYISKENQGL